MATLVLAAAGSAAGTALGGTIAGITTAAIGQAVGATLGSLLDARLLGGGAAPVEIGRVDTFRLQASREGAPIPRLFGQMRIAGQIIWSSSFLENVASSGGGKGPPKPKTRTYSYSISLAIALCEGEVSRIGRVWVDGKLLSLADINWRLYRGDENQLPDPTIAASLPDGEAPAYRGTAYVVIEDLDLTAFGNRIPQFAFEVTRKAGAGNDVDVADPAQLIEGVALVPGTGEYSYATEPVEFDNGKGDNRIVNINNGEGRPDIEVAMEQLDGDLPACQSVSLVISWFGDDLRAGHCTLRPKVEQTVQDGVDMPWRVAGVTRSSAEQVSYVDGRPGFGGTPADASVVQSIDLLRSSGKSVMFYPFILMDIRAGNGLPDPWSDGEQAQVPWRGRITTAKAPGRSGTTDQTAAATDEVAAFFGAASVTDFSVVDGEVIYSGPAEWSYRRFILHYAHLCLAAGGVDAFCIGSEMRALTAIRSARTDFPAVEALRVLAADVRAVLGSECRIGYAADWSEYFGYHPADGSEDVLYHLDPLWADDEIDFVGIDNYMPLSDWRDGSHHLDASAGSIYDLEYLRGNIEGGEGYDWYYAHPLARTEQTRQPISDGAYDMPWVYRYKDIRNWWGRPHWNRISGVRETEPTGWRPEGKPIWFTELGCPAVDKGTNQPNVFTDPQSSENALPYHSNGGQDDFIQVRYLQAMLGYWGAAENNPESRIYDGRMIDMSRAHVWAWDARPWPDFPSRLDVWNDGRNYGRGHWISGRTNLVALADVVREITGRSGLEEIDVSRLHGALRGLVISDTETARQSLQPLMLAYAFDAYDGGGALVFRTRNALGVTQLDPDFMVVGEQDDTALLLTRAPASETADQVRASFVSHNQDYQTVSVEARRPGGDNLTVARTDLPVAMSQDEAQGIAERWLAETHIGRDAISFGLPRSLQRVGLGDVVEIPGKGRDRLYRIDRVEEGFGRLIEAQRVERDLYVPRVRRPEIVSAPVLRRAARVYAEFLDLPLLRGTEVPHAPHIAVSARPWPGAAAIFSAAEDFGYTVVGEVAKPSVFGTLITELPSAEPGRFSAQDVVVDVNGGTLESRNRPDVLNGANVAALRFGGTGDWEVFQFQRADLVATRQYRLGGLLRGQAGTEPLIPESWPVGTDFVLLDGSATQPDLPLSARDLPRHYRIGPAHLPYDNGAYLHGVYTFEGVGLRPYSPVHLKADRDGDGAINMTWVRRTRIDGDGWRAADVPLGEAYERYHVRVLNGSEVLREFEPSTTAAVYSAAQQAVDSAPTIIGIEVAQISDRFGPGLYTRIDFDG
ncbi:baseplate multidomain protein megatron [Algicella marina]|uniref:Host specificity protein n=1 Tax=Algicella marina TaxID=2683284 RepID=A0A6P1T210_9RHOB|nr:glycoside hydrolase/phage tail family protein [Algicella marina]QHQ34562.1 host specificity protein [Algicella marina]